LVIGYGGSQSIDGPAANWSEVGHRLLRDLGVDLERFQTAFERTLYSSLGLSTGLFLPREKFGPDVLLSGDSLTPPGNAETRGLSNAKPLGKFVATLPIAEADKAKLLALYEPRDPLAQRAAAEKHKILRTTSYRDYLMRVCGCSAQVADCFQGRTLGFYGLGCDAVSAEDAREAGYPGFGHVVAIGARSEPYIYHFPDGNASLARLLV